MKRFISRIMALFVIAGDLRKMEVHTSVSEADVGQLARGLPVVFTVDAYPNETFRGTVREVRYEATKVSNVVTYDAVVEVENAETRVGVLEAQRASAEAQVRLAIANLEYTRVRAPFDGTVLRKDAEVGEIVAPSSAGGGLTRR